MLQLIECPRDAMQGWHSIIPTQQKINYINALLKVGFDTIDFGSFVSPKAIPQMADTAAVVKGLDLTGSRSKLLAIVANLRGAEEAVTFDEISCLGFPFSISPTFQLRNTNSTPEQSLALVEEMQTLCIKNQKQLVVYLSMGFGNPYGDDYNEAIVEHWVAALMQLEIEVLSIADTVGLATPEQVSAVLNLLTPLYPNASIGVHLHSSAANWHPKLEAALKAGCQRFDGALKGVGGCPMAGDELVGNMDTELMISYFASKGFHTGIDAQALAECSRMAGEIFV